MVAALLPFLGLLGAAGGLALRQPFQEREARQWGDYRRGLLADVDMSDPNARADALFGGGLLDTNQYQSDFRTGYEGNLDRQNRITTANIAAGPANARVAFEREVYANELAGIFPPLNPEQAADLTLRQSILEERRLNNEETRRLRAAELAAEEAERARQRLTAEQEATLASMAQTVELGNQLQPLYNDAAEIEWLMNNIDRASFTGVPSADQARMNSRLEQMILRQRNQFFNEIMGREDAPSESEAKSLAEIAFPSVENVWLDGNQRAVIMQNLARFLGDRQRRIADIEADARFLGQVVPRIESQFTPPGDWQLSGGN